jgi:hypothetical protein
MSVAVKSKPKPDAHCVNCGSDCECRLPDRTLPALTPKFENMKATKSQIDARVNDVLKLRLGGAEFPDIRQYASAPEQNWNVSDRQLFRYIAAADNLCEKLFDAKAGHLLARHLLQRRQLYAHALGAGDFGTALRVLQDEAKLESLYDLDLVRRLEALEAVAPIKKR